MAGAINGLTASPITSSDDESNDPIIATLLEAIQAVNSKHFGKARLLIEDALYATASKES